MPTGNRIPLVAVPHVEETDDLHEARRVLDGIARVEPLPSPSHREARRRMLQEADVLLVFAWRIGDQEIPLLQNVGLVQSVWAGVDRIPVAALIQAHPRLQVASGSGPNASQVAEHAVGLYLDCAKRITLRDRRMREGGWPQELEGRRVEGSRVAVVGYGAIGSRVGRILSAMGAQVTAVNRSGELSASERSDQVHRASLQELHEALAGHDGVVLTLPLTEETRGLVDRRFLAAMPKDGILVNVARGRLVVASDLWAHLNANPGFMAGLDVWWRYPKEGQVRRQDHPFEQLENVVMTPHSAFNVPGTRKEMVLNAAANVARYLQDGKPDNVVRVPSAK